MKSWTSFLRTKSLPDTLPQLTWMLTLIRPVQRMRRLGSNRLHDQSVHPLSEFSLAILSDCQALKFSAALVRLPDCFLSMAKWWRRILAGFETGSGTNRYTSGLLGWKVV